MSCYDCPLDLLKSVNYCIWLTLSKGKERFDVGHCLDEDKMAYRTCLCAGNLFRMWDVVEVVNLALFLTIDNCLFCLFISDSGKRKKKGSELEQIDCTPPEHILPGSKERPIVPLQPQNKDWKVRLGVRCTGGAVRWGFLIFRLSLSLPLLFCHLSYCPIWINKQVRGKAEGEWWPIAYGQITRHDQTSKIQLSSPLPHLISGQFGTSRPTACTNSVQGYGKSRLLAFSSGCCCCCCSTLWPIHWPQPAESWQASWSSVMRPALFVLFVRFCFVSWGFRVCILGPNPFRPIKTRAFCFPWWVK